MSDFKNQLLGGALQKASFEVYDKPDGSREKGYDIEFFLNPKSITIEKSMILEEPETQGNTTEVRWTGTNPVVMKLGELWFDTYESRKSVRSTYIDKLEKLLDYNTKQHHPPVVRLIWGDFTQNSDFADEYQFYLEKLTVDYTMFLPGGMPVRAKVQVGLKQVLPVKKKSSKHGKKSPDHAKVYTVKRGDTLQAIAFAEYDDARQWRRIAETNDLDDPMALRPGSKLLVPPILK
ncbi:MAG: LysM peptidoglycan-binding domain-containing protein [Myxococcota bacterium]